MKEYSDAHEAFLALLNDPPAEGPLSTLLGPVPCRSPQELDASLPSKNRYIGPGPWYAYLRTKPREE